jgi:tetratricopeptide (TPR) repeat protein
MQTRLMIFSLTAILCGTAYAQMTDPAPHEMTVDEARNVVLATAKPPAVYYDSNEKTNGFISEASILPKSISLKTYSKTIYLPLAHINPTMTADDPNATIISFNGHEAIAEHFGLSGASVGVFDRSTYPLLDKRVARRFLDALLVLKAAANRAEEDEELRFQDVARAYRTSTAQPVLDENVRRFRVQAEGAIHDKDFGVAAELYGQALALAPWWPEGHFNRALVLSETGNFSEAIVEMKRYLTLVPEAPDARAAQDKIYDWERKTG